MLLPHYFDPTEADLVSVGKLHKRHGKRGNITASFSVIFKKIPDHFLIFTSDGCIPYQVDDTESLGEELLIHFKNLDFDTSALLLNKKLYLDPFQFEQLVNKEIEQDFVNYTLMDENHDIVGTVTEVISYPGQTLLQFYKNDIEVLLPWVDAYVLSVNPKNKSIVVRIPEDLLNLNK